jgi:hypothetical protein
LRVLSWQNFMATSLPTHPLILDRARTARNCPDNKMARIQGNQRGK